MKNPNKDLRPISLTPIMSKIAEEFVVEEHVKPAILAKIKKNQFGAIPKSPCFINGQKILTEMAPPQELSSSIFEKLLN